MSTTIGPATMLYRLQTLDLAIAKRRNRLKEINAILGKDERLAAAQKRLEEAEKALKPWTTRSRDLDLEIQGLTQKIQTTDRSLYSGRITNPKELSDMQDEIAALKRHQSQLEDEMLEAMLHIEEGQSAVVVAQKGLAEAQASYSGAQVDLLAEQQRLQTELVEAEAQRKQVAAVIDPAAIAAYEALRIPKKGSAVALLQGETCLVCGVAQTGVIVSKVREGKELTHCGACNRILAPNA